MLLFPLFGLSNFLSWAWATNCLFCNSVNFCSDLSSLTGCSQYVPHKHDSWVRDGCRQNMENPPPCLALFIHNFTLLFSVFPVSYFSGYPIHKDCWFSYACLHSMWTALSPGMKAMEMEFIFIAFVSFPNIHTRWTPHQSLYALPTLQYLQVVAFCVRSRFLYLFSEGSNIQ